MKFEYLSPADQIIETIGRIYRFGMTTTSGGNLSVLGDDGDLWITPAGVDKGSLRREDIVRVREDGSIVGLHKPSSEYPFHRAIYRARPDLRAVVHAHPPALVAFSIVRRAPNIDMLPGEREICGEVGIAPYALPGSAQLGDNIAAVFAEGKRCVMLENHGIVVGGAGLADAYQAFETLEFCARMEIQASELGTPRSLTPAQQALAASAAPVLSALPERHGQMTVAEREARAEMCAFIRRAYEQRLFTSTQGTFSVKLAADAYLITPHGLDRKYMEPEDLVLIEGGAAEHGKRPSRSALLHGAIYERQPHVASVLVAHSPYTMAFALTDRCFDSKTIPEAYILLRGMPKLPFESVYETVGETAARFTPDVPLALVANNCVIAAGSSLLNAFDRLEVAEYSAKSIIQAARLGDIVHMDDASIRDIETAFKL